MTIISHDSGPGHAPRIGAIKRLTYCEICGQDINSKAHWDKCVPSRKAKITRLACPCCGVRLVLTEDK